MSVSFSSYTREKEVNVVPRTTPLLLSASCYRDKTPKRTDSTETCSVVATVLEAVVQDWVDLLLWASGVREGNQREENRADRCCYTVI